MTRLFPCGCEGISTNLEVCPLHGVRALPSDQANIIPPTVGCANCSRLWAEVGYLTRRVKELEQQLQGDNR